MIIDYFAGDNEIYVSKPKGAAIKDVDSRYRRYFGTEISMSCRKYRISNGS